MSTRFALEIDALASDRDHRLWIPTAVALNIFLDESFDQRHQNIRVVGAVDDRRPRFRIKFRLRAEFAAQEFQNVLRWAFQRLCDLDVVHDIRLDTVAATLHLHGRSLLHILGGSNGGTFEMGFGIL